MMPPCKKDGKDCPLRRVGCQPGCKDYIKYRAAIDREAKKNEPGRAADDYLNHSRRGRQNKGGQRK